MTTASCPNCLSELEALPEAGAPDALRCPVCHYAQRSCPRCGGTMVKQVLAPDELQIEASGLPLDRCELQWICQRSGCGAAIDATL